jgi:hypothetical protein
MTLVSSEFGDRQAKITGIVVLPPVGAFLADRAELGSGMLVSGPFFAALVKQGEAAANVAPGSMSANSGGFVGIDLRHGTDANAFVRSLEPELRSWDIHRVQPFVYTDPVRPPQIADAGSMRSGPLWLAALVAVALIGGLALTLQRAVRTRRHELAVLRALGCDRGDMYATMRWQALTVAALGLVVGLPIGVVAGRLTWSAFAKGLGISPAPQVSLVGLSILVVAVLALSVALAVVPGRTAAATNASAALRGE